MTGTDGQLKNRWGEPLDRPYKVAGPCLDRTVNAIIFGGVAGTFFGAVRVAWYPDPVSLPRRGTVLGATLRRAHRTAADVEKSQARAVARHVGRPAMWFAAVGAAFSGVECVAESVRGRGGSAYDDAVNAAAGGLVAGALCAASTRRLDIMAAAAAGTALTMFVLEFTGPETVADPEELQRKMHDVMPKRHQESGDLAALKDKYPKFRNL